jgi:hypothetical protein
VRTVLDYHLPRAFDELGGAQSRSRYGKDAVGIPVHHQRGDGDMRQVVAEVLEPAGDTRYAGGSGRSDRDIPARLDGLLADALSHKQIGVVEVLEELGEERITVGCYRLLNPCKNGARHTLWVIVRPQEVGRYTRDDHGFAHTPGTVFPQIACDLASSHGEAHQAEVAQLELGEQCVKVLCEGVVVVAGGRLARLAEASSVVGDDPETGTQEGRYLLLPGRTAQGVSVDQNNRGARAVILIVELEVARVLLSDCNVWHRVSPIYSMNRFVVARTGKADADYCGAYPNSTGCFDGRHQARGVAGDPLGEGIGRYQGIGVGLRSGYSSPAAIRKSRSTAP